MSALELEVVASPSEVALPALLELPATLGRDAENDHALAMPALGRRHCRFAVERGRAFVEDLGSTHGTWVNGVRCDGRVALELGDHIELPVGLVFRLVDGPTPPRFSLEGQGDFVKLVTDAPHDAAVWKVWADRLLETGNPLGERVARGHGAAAADDAKALGPLARDFLAGGLEVEWRHGFIRRAVLRNMSAWPPATWLHEWKLLLNDPLAAFVEDLEVDALSFGRGVDDRDGAVAKIVASLDALSARPALPLLQSVRFGPSPRQLWNRELERAWNRATEAHPSLRVGPIWVARDAWLQLLTTPAGVSVAGLDVGAQRKLFEDRANLVGPLPDCTFALEAPDGSPSSAVALRLDLENGLWVAEDMGAEGRRVELPLTVNGRRHARFRVRPGDVLEPAPGLTFKFVME